MATHSSTLAWRIPWMEEPGRLQSMGSRSRTRLSDFTFSFHFHALEKEMATHSSVLAWRIPGTGELGGLPSIYGVAQSRTRLKWLSSSSSLPGNFVASVGVPFSSLTLFLLEVLIALNHFLWVTVFCIYRELVLGQRTMWMSFDYNIDPSFLWPQVAVIISASHLEIHFDYREPAWNSMVSTVQKLLPIHMGTQWSHLVKGIIYVCSVITGYAFVLLKISQQKCMHLSWKGRF